MKNYIAFLIVAAVVALSQGATGQGNLPTPGGLSPIVGDMDNLPGMVTPQADLPPGADVPAMPDPAVDRMPSPHGAGESLADALSQDAFVPGQTMRMIECEPALVESTGTWLRRGFWYAEVDAVIFSRIWNANSVTLASEITGQTSDPSGFRARPIENGLLLDQTDPGADGLPRLTLGKFLFRDGENRDHMAELTWFGGGQWTQRGAIEALNVDGVGDGLQVSDIIDRSTPGNGAPGNPSFDGAAAMDYRYDGHLDSIEINYLVRQRMRRDQMILQPDGQWVRRATPSRTLSFLAGIRYLNARDAFAWNASGIPDANGNGARESGRYFVATDNNIIGTQFGGSFARETARWSLGLDAKIGGYWNAMDLNGSLDITGDVASVRYGGTDDNLSVVAEASLIGKWHITPRWSLRAGAEVLWVDSMALAPHQLTFLPSNSGVVVDTGGLVFLGTSIGVESYW